MRSHGRPSFYAPHPHVGAICRIALLALVVYLLGLSISSVFQSSRPRRPRSLVTEALGKAILRETGKISGAATAANSSSGASCIDHICGSHTAPWVKGALLCEDLAAKRRPSDEACRCPLSGPEKALRKPIIVGCLGGSGSRGLAKLLSSLGVAMPTSNGERDFAVGDEKTSAVALLSRSNTGAHYDFHEIDASVTGEVTERQNRGLRVLLGTYLRHLDNGHCSERLGWKQPWTIYLLPLFKSMLTNFMFVHLVTSTQLLFLSRSRPHFVVRGLDRRSATAVTWPFLATKISWVQLGNTLYPVTSSQGLSSV